MMDSRKEDKNIVTQRTITICKTKRWEFHMTMLMRDCRKKSEAINIELTGIQ